MGYKNSSLKAIHEGPRNTPKGKAVIQGKDVFPSAYAGPKKATNSVNDEKRA
jgi:hypothetical protein